MAATASTTAATQFSLPPDFLSGPAPDLTISKIEFHETKLKEYTGHYAVVLDGCLTKDECDALVAAAEAHSDGAVWEKAMINIGYGIQHLDEETRNCDRIIWDSPDMVSRIWSRIESAVPELQTIDQWPIVTGTLRPSRKGVYKLTRVNERMRFLRYQKGEYFKPHADGAYVTPDGKEHSLFTIHLYLNDKTSNPEEPLVGGATTFHSYNMKERLDVHPKIGRILLFQHRNLIHSGDDVLQGTKLTMRSDIMYGKAE